ncbi:MAG: hypothetical protein ACI9LM_005296 [Alteromonadaceae bacterium]|jgi:hypothetical protein
MNIVSYGGGTNSTALLIECANRSIPIDLILFADTGGEKPHTYKYLKMFSKWCASNGLPEIQTVQQVNQNGTYITLEQICLNASMLPSLAYGFKSCSLKHKVAPQDKYVNNWPQAKEEWKLGNKITKFIGYDADEPHRAKLTSDKKYIYQHPLIEWDMGRDECIETIKKAGLDLPGKSACFFCPSSKKTEIMQLKDQYPHLMNRALAMEKNANLTTVKGLGRGFAWGDLVKQEDAFGYEMPLELDCDCYDG